MCRRPTDGSGDLLAPDLALDVQSIDTMWDQNLIPLDARPTTQHSSVIPRCLGFPGLVALDDVSLTVSRQTVHAICGENGAGKFRDLGAKQEIFRRLDGLLQESVPILSNTSGLSSSDIARGIRHPERSLTTHFWLPALLVPLVEIVVGEHTSAQLAAQIKTELHTWGKSLVIVNADVPGQLANRILQAVIREAVSIVKTGLATPEDVATAVKMGIALRFPVWGRSSSSMPRWRPSSSWQSGMPLLSPSTCPVGTVPPAAGEANL